MTDDFGQPSIVNVLRSRLTRTIVIVGVGDQSPVATGLINDRFIVVIAEPAELHPEIVFNAAAGTGTKLVQHRDQQHARSESGRKDATEMTIEHESSSGANMDA